MSRDGFGTFTADSSWWESSRWRKLRRNLRETPDLINACVVIYWTTTAASWRDADRARAEDVAPEHIDLEAPVAALVEAGLFDPQGRVAVEDWQESFGDAVDRRLERQRSARFAGYRRQGMPQQEANAAVARREDEERAALSLKPKAPALGSASSLLSSSPASSLAGTHQPGGGRQAASADGRLDGAPSADAFGGRGVANGWDSSWHHFFRAWVERGFDLPSEAQELRLRVEVGAPRQGYTYSGIGEYSSKLDAWVREAPGTSADEVIDHVIERATEHSVRRHRKWLETLPPEDGRRRELRRLEVVS